jgi:hypothetical protein
VDLDFVMRTMRNWLSQLPPGGGGPRLWILVVVLSVAWPDRAAAGTLLSESFADDPVAGGRAVIDGAAARFHSAAAEGVLRAEYDSLLPTARLNWPLGTTLDPSGDFRFDVRLAVQADGFFADPNQFGQISFGLIHSTRTGPDRSGGDAAAGDAFDLVTLDYFPNISPTFGGPTLTPTIIQSDNGAGFFNRVLFPQLAESLLDDPGEGDLPRDVPLEVSLVYLAATRTATLRVTGPLGPLPINAVGGSAGIAGGGDGDPATIQLTAPPTVDFALDTFSVALWQDSFAFGGSSVRATLAFDSLAVYDAATVPEPAAAGLALVGVLACWVVRRQRTSARSAAPAAERGASSSFPQE